MNKTILKRDICVGVLGAFRGKQFAVTAAACGMKLVAICDHFKPRLDAVCGELNVKGYTDFDEFIQQDFDAVVIASPFQTHAYFAKNALKAGKHVLCETSSNATLADGVELYRIAQETGLCYMLAENYCYTRHSQELRRLYKAGEIGTVRYAEGEYNHPMDINTWLWYSPGAKHWRNWLPWCYYTTHALAPLMFITDTVPVQVSCSEIPALRDEPGCKYDRDGFVMLVRMDNGAIFRLYGGVAGHSIWYSLHGTCGAMESGRGGRHQGPETVRVWHEPWMCKPDQEEEKVYYPKWSDHAEEAEKSGHCGGDFFVELNFADAIRTGQQPYLDAYHSITMTNVGIIAWRSIHEKGRFIDVPDLYSPAAQESMLQDRLTPFPGVVGGELMPNNMLSKQVSFDDPETMELARKNWKRHGYTDEEIEALLQA